MSRRTLALSAAVIGTVSVLYVLHVTLCWRVEHRGYNCAVCAARQSRETLRIFGIPVRDVWTEPRKTPLTDIYDDCIGESHEHRWAGGARSVTAGGLGSRRLHTDGAHVVPPFSFMQPRLTAVALHAVGRVRHWTADDRKQLLHAILDGKDPEWFEELFRTEQDAKTGDAEAVWRQWLDKQAAVQTPSGDE